MASRRALLISTVSQSLVCQSPQALASLRELGFELSFAAARDDWTEQLRDVGEFIELPFRRSVDASAYFAYRKLSSLISESWDLVQVQSPIASGLARLNRRIRTSPSIYVAHGFHFHRDGGFIGNLLAKRAESFLAPRTSAVAVVSDEDFNAARRLGFGRRSLLWRLPGAGVDLSRFRQEWKVNISRSSSRFVLFCGELNANKNPILAIRVVDALRRRGHDLELVLVGAGPLRDEISAWEGCGWLRVYERLDQSDIAWLMQRASVLVAPSRREGLPRVIIEAIASGLPVAARDNRGSRELLAPQIGELVRGADITSWVQAVDRLLARGRLTRNETDFIARYDQRSFKRSYEELVSSVLRGTPGVGSIDLADQC